MSVTVEPRNDLSSSMQRMWRYVPIVALYRGVRGMNRRQWRVFLTTFFLVMFLGNSIAQAADGTGITTLIPLQDLAHGGAKNLVEDVPASRYSLDYTEGGITHPIIDTMNGLASALILTVAEIGWIVVVIMSWLLGSAGLFEDSLDISPMLGTAATEVMGWLFPTALALGAVFTYFDYLKDKGKILNGLLTLIITAVAAASLAIYPQAWIKGVETSRAVGNQLVIAVMDSSGGSPAEPFEYNSVGYSGNNESEAFTRQATDAVWRSMVVTPWCMAEFGDLDVCKKYGKEILSQSDPDKRKKTVETKVLKDVGKDSETGKYISGEAWANRLGTTFIACLITLILAVLISSLVIGALVAFVQSLFLLLLGLFFLTLGMIPGVPRQWASSWAYMLAGALGSNIVSMLLLSVSVGFITAVTLSGLVWGMQFFLMMCILFAAFGLKQVIGNIVGAQNSDSGGGLSRTLSRVAKTMAMRQVFRSVTGNKGARSTAHHNTSNNNRQSINQQSQNTSNNRRDRNRNNTVSNRLNMAKSAATGAPNAASRWHGRNPEQGTSNRTPRDTPSRVNQGATTASSSAAGSVVVAKESSQPATNNRSVRPAHQFNPSTENQAQPKNASRGTERNVVAPQRATSPRSISASRSVPPPSSKNATRGTEHSAVVASHSSPAPRSISANRAIPSRGAETATGSRTARPSGKSTSSSTSAPTTTGNTSRAESRVIPQSNVQPAKQRQVQPPLDRGLRAAPPATTRATRVRYLPPKETPQSSPRAARLQRSNTRKVVKK